MKGYTIKSGDKRPTKKGAGMTAKGVAKYRRENPGSKLKTAVTGKVKPGSKAAKRRKSFCARSAGQMKKFPKAAKNPNSRLRQARKRWKCQMIKKLPKPRPRIENLTENQQKRLLRTYIANMPQKERTTFLNKAIKKVYPKSFPKVKVKK